MTGILRAVRRAAVVQWVGPFVEKITGKRAHLSREYSTYDWILEGLLERAGFRIDQAISTGGVLGDYFCTRAG